jgi:hypothetical protein
MVYSSRAGAATAQVHERPRICATDFRIKGNITSNCLRDGLMKEKRASAAVSEARQSYLRPSHTGTPTRYATV